MQSNWVGAASQQSSISKLILNQVIAEYILVDSYRHSVTVEVEWLSKWRLWRSANVLCTRDLMVMGENRQEGPGFCILRSRSIRTKMHEESQYTASH